MPLQVLVFSYVLNKEIEEITSNNIASIILVTLGAILVVYGGRST